MGEYWGAKEICSRMGWLHTSTVPRQIRQNGFLAYLRRWGSNPRRYYYTNDTLITAWEIACCRADREKLLEHEAAKQGQGGDQTKEVS
jgi:hypothetical protein